MIVAASGLFYASYVALWVLVTVLALLMIVLLRHFGLVTMGTLEGVQRDGLPVGDPAPTIVGVTRDGEPYASGMNAATPRLIVFGAPGCEPCANVLPDHRASIVGAAGTAALFLAVTRWGQELGRHRQVPRQWGRTMPRRRAFLLWGVLLGSGVATLIPYSSVVLVLGTEVAAGPLLGALIGGALGLGRESMTLLSLGRRLDLARIMEIPERFAASGPRVNLALAATGTVSALASALLT